MNGLHLLAGLVAVLATAASAPDRFAFDVPVAPGHSVEPLNGGSPGIANSGLICLRDGATIVRLRAGRPSERRDFGAAATDAIVRDVLPDWDGSWDKSLMVDTAIAFDSRDIAYTIIVPRSSNLPHAVLLWSRDGCASWHAAKLSSRNATIEKRGAFTDIAVPPTILSHENYGGYTGRRLWLDLFRWEGDRLVRRAPPLLAAKDSLYTVNHSGGGNATLTGGGRVVLVYPVVGDANGQGALAVARELNLATLRWAGPAAPVARSTTTLANDNHDLPAVARLPSGRLIVVIGAHHARLQLVESRAHGTIAQGWGAPFALGDPARGKAYAEYSYASLNVSRRGVVNIVARAEGRRGHYDLVQFRRTARGGWQDWPGGAPHRPLVVARRPAYGAWRHRVSEGPTGRLYLHFAYWPNSLTDVEAADLRLRRPAEDQCSKDRCWYGDVPTLTPRTLVSDDDGATWR